MAWKASGGYRRISDQGGGRGDEGSYISNFSATDMEVQVTCVNGPRENCGLWARYNDDSTNYKGYRCQVESGVLALAYIVGASTTDLGSGSTSITEGMMVKLECVGGAITTYYWTGSAWSTTGMPSSTGQSSFSGSVGKAGAGGVANPDCDAMLWASLDAAGGGFFARAYYDRLLAGGAR